MLSVENVLNAKIAKEQQTGVVIERCYVNTVDGLALSQGWAPPANYAPHYVGNALGMDWYFDHSLSAGQFRLEVNWPPDTRLPLSGDLGILKPDGVK